MGPAYLPQPNLVVGCLEVRSWPPTVDSLIAMGEILNCVSDDEGVLGIQ
jgi:hypothetical protein